MTRFWQTTEFWIGTLYILAATVLTGMKILTPVQWLEATTVVVGALVLARGISKSAGNGATTK